MTIPPAVIRDPVAQLLAAAARYQKVVEVPRNSNRSVHIDLWHTEVGVPVGNPWCASYISYVGRWALGAAWPVVRSAGCQAIYDWGKKNACIAAGSPEPGDLMVLYYPSLGRYGHIGIVISATATSVTCWEGNTNSDGSREGYTVAKKVRPITDRMRFVRWTRMLEPVGQLQ